MDAERLILYLKEMNLDPKPYSGRYMYGKQCVGVSVPDAVRLAMLIAAYIQEHETSGNGDITEEVMVLSQGTRIDTIGMGYLLYWPDVKWPSPDAVVVD